MREVEGVVVDFPISLLLARLAGTRVDLNDANCHWAYKGCGSNNFRAYVVLPPSLHC